MNNFYKYCPVCSTFNSVKITRGAEHNHIKCTHCGLEVDNVLDDELFIDEEEYTWKDGKWVRDSVKDVGLDPKDYNFEDIPF